MPVLDYRNGQFVFECAYEQRALPKEARFWFDPLLKAWVTGSARCAIRLREYATQEARARFVDVLQPGFRGRDTFGERHSKGGRINRVRYR